MRKNHFIVAAGLAVVLVLALLAGYQFAPGLVLAAQHQEQPSSAIGVPPAALKPPATANAKVKPLLGVRVTDGTNSATIASVAKDSPAAKAGLREGDTITAVDGRTVSNAAQFVERIQALQPGDKATLSVQRDGTAHTIEVILGTLPARSATPKRAPLPKHPTPVPNPLGAFGGLAPELRDIPTGERFDHYRGSSFSFTDRSGAAITVRIIPGIITAIAADTLTMRPNGAAADLTFRVQESTRVFPSGRANLTENFKVGDKVVVTARQDSSDAEIVYDLTPRTNKQGSQGKEQGEKPTDSKGKVPHFRLFPNGDRSFGLAPGLNRDLQRGLDQLQERLRQLRERLNEEDGGA